MRVVSPSESRRLDAEAIASGTPGILLMERAAAAVAREVGRLVRARPERAEALAVLCGAGNNGGDGFEAARLLLEGGWPAGRLTVLFLGRRDRLPEDAAETFRRLAARHPVIPIVDEAGLEPLRRASLVVDALFGTGLTRPLEEGSLAARAVGAISTGRAAVVAVDVPSGLDGAVSGIPGPHVRADVTVTFGFPKAAHVRLPAAGECGRIVVAPIGLPGEEGGEGPEEGEAATAGDVARLFPGRPAASHKGTFGTVLVVGGSTGMAGAPALAARAAFRAGAGKVVVSAPDGVRAIVHGLCPEATTAGEAEEPGGYSALAVGPGLGRDAAAVRRFSAALGAAVPAAFDADALNLVGTEPERFGSRPAPTVLTPHPGEAARLLGVDTRAISSDREGAARELAKRSRAVVVLKGFRSLVAGPDGRSTVVLAGNPGMATGGTGDVLTGVVAAFLARGLGAREAAWAGAWLHGAAGDLAAERLGAESLCAGDVAEALPAAWGLLTEARLA